MSALVVADVGRTAIVGMLVVIAGSRLVWFGDFFRRSWVATAGSQHRSSGTWAKVIRSTNELQRGTAERHQKLLDLEARRVDTLLVGGSVGLAAWSQLFVSSGTEPASRLSGLTLGLLLSGAACLIIGPLLWRSEGLHLTLMGRTTAMHVGFGLIAFSLASAVLDLGLPLLAGVVSIVVVVLIGLRDGAEVITWVARIHPLLRF